ncbi:MAG: nucleotide exchange factor GrpE [bacterium]|nr:nucleotide exchange factor GrpE [bacterium]
MKEWHGDDIAPEDIVIDSEVEAEGGDPAAAAGNKITKMHEELSACRKDKQEYMDGWQRAKADYVNLLRRSEQQAVSRKQEGVTKAVEMLLPAFDALERAKEHGEISDGFLAIAKQLENAFVSLGLEELGKVGEKFNPEIHDALRQDVVESLEIDNTITVVLEKGWKVGDKIIRPAKVHVGHFANEK